MKGCSFMKCFALVMLMAISSAASALDCQHPNSTPENNQCAALDAAAADTKLNETYQRVLALFEGPNDEAGRWYPASTKASLIAAEREWIKYRDDNTAHPQRQPLQKIPQQLIAAQLKFLWSGWRNSALSSGLEIGKPALGEDLVHVHILQLEGDAQFLQHHIVGDALFHRARRQAFVAAAAMHHQTIEEMRQHLHCCIPRSRLLVLSSERPAHPPWSIGKFASARLVISTTLASLRSSM
jgi:uncharacterized protein YecT (DUF1311 family)